MRSCTARRCTHCVRVRIQLPAHQYGAGEESAQDPWLQADPWSRRPGVESSGISTDSKKHFAENLREQADRSATSSTLDVVQAPCNTMTPVAPGSQLSSEANAIVAAINGSLAPRLDGIQGQMGMVATQMTRLKSDVVQLSAQVQHHDKRMSEFERQLKDITAGRSTGSGAASSAASAELYPESARRSGTVHPPKNQRTVLVVGGCAYDTERDVICEKLRDIRTRARRQRLVDSGEGRISGKGQLPHKRPFVDLPQEIQGQEVQSRCKASVAHLGSPRTGSPPL